MPSFVARYPRAALVVILLTPRLVLGQFTPKCTNPHFPEPAPKNALDIDATCGLAGKKGGSTKEGPQNIAKNNFCATGPAKAIEIADMITLQHAAEADPAIGFGDKTTASHQAGPTMNRKSLE